MRVISLVPSWTETLIEAGVDVCGRTRFCIHPSGKVNNIPVVGGTKQVDWEKIKNLKADLILLDKEENPLEFARRSPVPVLATHVSDIVSAGRELHRLATQFNNKQLELWAQEFLKISRDGVLGWGDDNIPACIKPLTSRLSSQKILYVIWKDPWMVVQSPTYIASVLNFLGAPMLDLKGSEKYPKIDHNILKENYGLFASEPYPFAEKSAWLIEEGFSGALVDGEKFSWFGIRGLNFLKECRRKT